MGFLSNIFTKKIKPEDVLQLPPGSIGMDTSGTPVYPVGGTPKQMVVAIGVTEPTRVGGTGGGGIGVGQTHGDWLEEQRQKARDAAKFFEPKELPMSIAPPPTPFIESGVTGKIRRGDPREIKYETALIEAAREKGGTRGLTLSEREAIAGGIYDFRVEKRELMTSGIRGRTIVPMETITPKVTTGKGFVIEPYIEVTKEEKVEERRLGYTYGEKGFLDFVGETYRATALGDIFKDVGSWFGKERVTTQQEAFGVYPTPTTYAKGTMAYSLKPEKELSESALIFRKEIKEEIPKQVRIEQEILGKRKEIITRISPEGITEVEALAGTKELKEFSKTKWEEYMEGYKERGKRREQEVFKLKHPLEFGAGQWLKGKTPDFPKIKTYELEKDIFGKVDVGGVVGGRAAGQVSRISVGALTFGKGAYEGIRTRPIKTIGTGLIVAGVSATTAGLGTIPSISAYAIKAAPYIKATQIGIGALYGGSVALRIGMTPGYYEKWGKTGEMFGTEAIPIYAGYKLGTRTGFRIQRQVAYHTTIKNLEKQYGVGGKEVKEFKTEWDIAFKQLKRYTPPEKSWTAKDVKPISGQKKAIQITKEWTREYKPQIIGSTVISPQTTLMKPPRGLAGDIDIQRIMMTKLGTKKAALELFRRLKVGGVKDVGWDMSTFAGKPKYHITVGKHLYKGKLVPTEFANIGVSSKYYYGQIEPTLGMFDIKRFGWVKDPYGVKMASLRDQMRVKIWKGYVERARVKDIIDVKGIAKSFRTLPHIKSTMGMGGVRFTGQSPQPLSLGIGVQGEIGVGGGIKDFRISRIKPISYTQYTGQTLKPFLFDDSVYKKRRKTKPSYGITTDIGKSFYTRMDKQIPSLYTRRTSYSPIPPKPPITPSLYKSIKPGLFFPPIIDITRITKKKKTPIIFGDITGALGKAPKEKFRRPFVYQPGVLALAMRWSPTKFPKLKKVPRTAITGITTRFEVPKRKLSKGGKKK